MYWKKIWWKICVWIGYFLYSSREKITKIKLSIGILKSNKLSLENEFIVLSILSF